MPQTSTTCLPCRLRLFSRLLCSQHTARPRPTTSSTRCQSQQRCASAVSRPTKAPVYNKTHGENKVWHRGDVKTTTPGSLEVRCFATKGDWTSDRAVGEEDEQELTRAYRRARDVGEEEEDDLMRVLRRQEGVSEEEDEELRRALLRIESTLPVKNREMLEEVYTLYLRGKVARPELERFAAELEQGRSGGEDWPPEEGVASTLDEGSLEGGLQERAPETGEEKAETFKQGQRPSGDMRSEGSGGYALQDTAVHDTAFQDTALQDTAVQDTVVQDTVVQDTVVQDPIVPDTAVQDTEAVVREARQRFGDRLPEGTLSDKEYKIYERLYGSPLRVGDENEEIENEDEDEAATALLKEGEDGELEEVELESAETDELSNDEEPSPEEDRPSRRRGDAELAADARLRKEMVAAQASDSDYEAHQNVDAKNLDSDDETSDSEDLRAHPFTLAARFTTNPSTLVLPRAGLIGPVTVMLADLSNKHLDDTSQRVFGGPGLPYSTGTPRSSRTMPQKPIPLTAGQGKMSAMEADVYCAAVMPGVYASVMSVLVEVRKRIGKGWLKGLLAKEEGPRILDAGAGGAGVLAWREILKAEWDSMQDRTATELVSARLGKATVLTGSAALRQRASVLLENTTFLPRLPDYIHASGYADNSSTKKQFDVIVAPHSLWCLQEDYMRRQLVQNLWSLLDPNGGVLVLLEKGVPRGFEVIAGARQHLLTELFANQNRLREEEVETDVASIQHDHSNPATTSNRTRDNIARHPGKILAPCTNHNKCPMYTIPGISKGRKDYCHFSQRYIRPPYFQRMLGAKDRNHEDVRFSYVAVQKGLVDGMGKERADALVGKEATDRAFEGYDIDDKEFHPTESATLPADTIIATSSGNDATTSATEDDARSRHFEASAAPLLTNPLPRQILPPLKRKGHIILDLCTPSGTLERWTVSKSYGAEAYRDARKSKWGDLWALGAKTRVPRGMRLGRGDEDGSGRVRDVKGSGRAEEDDGETVGGTATDRKEERVRTRKQQKVPARPKASRREETRRLMGSEDV